MNPTGRLAGWDQEKAAYRDYAAHCRAVFDELLKHDFTRDEAVTLTLPVVDVMLGAERVAST